MAKTGRCPLDHQLDLVRGNTPGVARLIKAPRRKTQACKTPKTSKPTPSQVVHFEVAGDTTRNSTKSGKPGSPFSRPSEQRLPVGRRRHKIHDPANFS
jgi:hypothetical protein